MTANNHFISRPIGLRDKLSAQAAALTRTIAQLEDALTRFAYRPVETPALESAELFLTKSGDEWANRLFSFEMYGRQIGLRPELTAGIARLYVENFQHHPKPLRLRATGPVFRYESPGRATSRQFPQVDAELIGASGPAADSEILALTCRGLEAAGITDYRLVIGHVGLILSALRGFQLDQRIQRVLLAQLENLRREGRGIGYVREQVERFYAGPSEEVSAEAPNGDAAFESSLSHILESLRLGPVGNRTPAEIAARLLKKQRRARQKPELHRALAFLNELAHLSGKPGDVLPELHRILGAHGVHAGEIDAFAQTLDLLEAYEVGEVTVEMGLGRGVAYYTGINFAAYAPAGGPNAQLASGGRYDELLRLFGANQETPAIGMAFYLERILDALETAHDAPGHARFLIVALDGADRPAAIRLAEALRAEGERVEMAERGIRGALGHADKLEIPYVILIGEDERKAGTFALRKMTAHEQFTWPLDDAAGLLEKLTTTEAAS